MGNIDDAFELFWRSCPRREGANPKRPAKLKYTVLVRTIKPEDLQRAADLWRKAEENNKDRRADRARFIPMVITWLNQYRFEQLLEDTPALTPEQEAYMAKRGYIWTGNKWEKKHGSTLPTNHDTGITVEG